MTARVLVVEDNRASRKLAADVLRRAGYEVAEASTADEGLALARAGGVALVVMDIQLPGIDGLAATRTLRADPAIRHLPVLAVTAHAMRGDEERVRAAGCDGYLPKPLAYKDLLAEVARLLGGAP